MVRRLSAVAAMAAACFVAAGCVRIQATPFLELEDGQTVQVTVTGLDNATDTALYQCRTFDPAPAHMAEYCDLGSRVPLGPTFTVHRHITTASGTYDCVAYECRIVAVGTYDINGHPAQVGNEQRIHFSG